MRFLPRPFQLDARAAIEAEYRRGIRSTLLVLATGLGKTFVFCDLIASMHWARTLVLAHREELVFQAAAKVEQATGFKPDIEMGELRAGTGLYGKSRVVVSSIQTQLSGEGRSRMENFDGFDFIVIDEAHRAVSPSYRQVLKYYREQNPKVLVLGVTATPIRADHLSLAAEFESCAFSYGLREGIRDGWLVPLESHAIHVHGLDYSSVRPARNEAGLNSQDTAKLHNEEELIHRMVSPCVDVIGERRFLSFCNDIRHTDKVSEIFNRWMPGRVDWLHGDTPRDTRRDMLKRFVENHLQGICNCDVLTEGYDDAGVEVIIHMAATPNIMRYEQMTGRGTRPWPGVVDGLATAAQRRAAIAASRKPRLEVIDFVGNSGRHRLATAVDVLAGRDAPDVAERAKRFVRMNRHLDVERALAMAGKDLEEERIRREQERLAKEAAETEARKLRAHVKLRAFYTVEKIDPFDMTAAARPAAGTIRAQKPLSPKQLKMLERAGIDGESLMPDEGRRLCGELLHRWKQKLCTVKQARILRKHGHPVNISKEAATKILDEIFAKQRAPRERHVVPKHRAEAGRY